MLIHAAQHETSNWVTVPSCNVFEIPKRALVILVYVPAVVKKARCGKVAFYVTKSFDGLLIVAQRGLQILRYPIGTVFAHAA